jgi:hypothetical protein
MQPWLHPMQVVNASPAAARRGIEGSVIRARVIPQASHSPRAIIASASAGSTIRPVAITGTSCTRAFMARAKEAMALCSTGTGGTMKLEPR